ncbi:MAG: helix-turn-helix domain-containing protein [Pirellulaceae bacterium]
MPESPTIDRSVTTAIVKAIAEIAGNVEELLSESELSRLWADSSVTELPEDRVWRLFESAARRHACHEIGVYAGSHLTVPDLGPFGEQLRRSLTLYQCLNRYIQTVTRYSSHARFWTENERGSLWFYRKGIDLIPCGQEQVEQFTVQLMIRIVQLATGEDWMPARIRIQAVADHAFRKLPLLDKTEIEFDCLATAIQIPQVPGLECIAPDKDEPALVRQIRDKFVQGPNAYQMDIDDMVSELNVSRRTLQRKLAIHGVDWSQLVEKCRFRKAIRQLKMPEVPLIDLAHDLGYTDQANFGRAFRRWAGMSPATYRRWQFADGEQTD